MFTSKTIHSTKHVFFLRTHLMRKKLILTTKVPAKITGTLLSSRINSSPKVLLKLSNEGSLNNNWNLLETLQSYNTKIQQKTIKNKVDVALTQVPALIKFTPIYLTLSKEFTLLHWGKKRQYFFFLFEVLTSLEKSNGVLLKDMSFFFNSKNAYVKEKAGILLYYNYLFSIFNGKSNNVTLGSSGNFYTKLFLNHMQTLLISSSFSLLGANVVKQNTNFDFKKLSLKQNILDMYTFWNLSQERWEEFNLPPVVSQNIDTIAQTASTLSLKRSKRISIIKRRTQALPFYTLRNYPMLTSNLNVKSFVWKQVSTLTNDKSLENVIKLSRLYNKTYNNNTVSFQVLYLINRVEEKILQYSKQKVNEKLTQKLVRLRNLLYYLVEEKRERYSFNSGILATKNAIIRLRTKTWKIKLLNFLQKSLTKFDISKNLNFYAFFNLVVSRLSLGRKSLRLKNLTQQKKSLLVKHFIFAKHSSRASKMFGLNLNVKKYTNTVLPNTWRNKIVSVKRTWVNSKVTLTEKHLNFAQKKAILSSWINRPVDLFFINALSLTKFAFKNERAQSPNNNPNLFLSVLDRDFINKYKYIGIYIKDLVRVAFISVFFKKPSFLAKFMAFQLAKLPRNRKETNFVRFLIKVIKTFAAERKEILGLRIRFKGRVNRWRRTKFILGNRGTLPLQTISERIEQGTAQAVNKKGAVGIRIWLRYKQTFSFVLQDHILKYINYSKLIKMRKTRRLLTLK